MSDFDFDEIDKAVNSALNGQAAGDSSRVSEVNRELTVPTRQDSAATPAASTGRNLDATSPRAASETNPASMSIAAADAAPAPTPTTDAATPAPASGTATLAPAADDDINAAVNSMVAGVASDTSQTNQTSAGQDEAQSAEANLDSSSSKPGLPTRRSGRFMDVVHPSSDMRTTSMTPRKPANISPISTGLEEDLASDDQAANDSSVELEAPVATEPIESDHQDIALDNGLKAEDLPPPIDLDKPINTELTSQIDSLLSSESASGSAPAAAPAPVSTPLPETPTPLPETPAVATPEDSSTSDSGLDFEETPDLSKVATEPLTSPFIEGVAVNKRPLGSADQPGTPAPLATPAPETSPPLEAVDPAASHKKSGYSEELKHPDDVTAADVLPAELDNKLVSIESNADTGNKAPAETPRTDNSPEASGPTSITKQYKEKVRTDNQDASGDIFDTKNYHKPIKDEAKSKGLSPVLIAIIVIVVILLIAAGVFAAWWAGLFTLPF